MCVSGVPSSCVLEWFSDRTIQALDLLILPGPTFWKPSGQSNGISGVFLGDQGPGPSCHHTRWFLCRINRFGHFRVFRQTTPNTMNHDPTVWIHLNFYDIALSGFRQAGDATLTKTPARFPSTQRVDCTDFIGSSCCRDVSHVRLFRFMKHTLLEARIEASKWGMKGRPLLTKTKRRHKTLKDTRTWTCRRLPNFATDWTRMMALSFKLPMLPLRQWI